MLVKHVAMDLARSRGFNPQEQGTKNTSEIWGATSQQTRTIVMWNVDQKLGQNIRMHRRILGWYLTIEIIIWVAKVIWCSCERQGGPELVLYIPWPRFDLWPRFPTPHLIFYLFWVFKLIYVVFPGAPISQNESDSGVLGWELPPPQALFFLLYMCANKRSWSCIYIYIYTCMCV